MADTKISIIVPAYQAERYLGWALKSVLAQTYEDWEMVVVDDGSSDRTGEIAAGYAASDPRIRVVTQPNAGPSAARNRGYAAIGPSTDAVIFLDSDDVWEENALATLSAALRARPECLAAHGLARAVDKDGEITAPGSLEGHQRQRWGVGEHGVELWPPERPTGFAVEAVMERIITAGTVLIRRTALEKSGLFDPQIRMWEDWDLWLRLCLHGDMAFVDKPVLRYRRHDTNLSNQRRALEAGERHVRRKMLASLRTDPEHLRIARLGQRYYQYLRVHNGLRETLADLKRGRLRAAAGHIPRVAGGLPAFLSVSLRRAKSASA